MGGSVKEMDMAVYIYTRIDTMNKIEDTKTMELELSMGNQMEMILEIEIICMDIITDMEIIWNIIWETIGMKGITIIWDI